MGAVFEAVHERLQKRVAIKTLHEQFARDAKSVERFLREGRAASRIRHGHVIDVTDVGTENGTPFLVMELLEGESLAGLIRRHGPLSLDAIADIALPVLDALDAAHQAGIVHRDLKPENIFVSRSRSGSDVHPMILDFGISCIEDEVRMTKTAHFIGTPHYMSPEQAQSAKSVDARSDQFSLGLVFFECATGRRGLSGDSVLEVVHRVSTEGAIRLGVVRADLPRAFTSMIDMMTERDPTRRFRSMRHVGESMVAFASPRGVAMWGHAFQAGGRSLPGSSVPIASTPSLSQAPSIQVSMPSSFSTHDAPANRPSFSAPQTRSSDRPGTPHPVLTPSFTPRSSSAGRSSADRSSSVGRSSSEGASIAVGPTVDARLSTQPRPTSDPPIALTRAKRRSPVLLAIVAVTGVLVAVGVAFIVGTTLAHQQEAVAPTPAPTTVAAVAPPPTSAPPPAPIDVRIRALPATAEIVLDGNVVGTGTYSASLERDGIPHLLEVRAAGFIPHDIQFVDIAPIAQISLDPIPSHHRGPVVAQHSQMTSNGLVAATSPPLPVAAAQGAGASGLPVPGQSTPPPPTSEMTTTSTTTDVAAPPTTTLETPPPTTTTTPPPVSTTVAAPPPTTRATDWASEPGSPELLQPF